MDSDDLFPTRPDDPLRLLARQDLDPLSVEELDARVAALLAEIERVKARRAFAVNHKASAEALFSPRKD
ncbi:MAG: DUF1192 domain-containing protein [Sphingopyxis sp.]|jgi:uncharacterized small protein (DUF1192 family)|nr:DUF1192 domain-containing protein [Sphingopyxis sp.]